VNDSAVKVLGDEALSAIARELTEKVRASTSIDWTLKESARARIRVLVKEILRKHKYPPDKTPAAVQLVLDQAALLSDEWARELSLEELQARYGELGYRRAIEQLTLAEAREMRQLETEMQRLGEMATEPAEPTLRAAEDEPEYTP